jgi:hypothetical protein
VTVEDYPIKRPAIAIQELLAAANSWSLACAQQVNYLRDARKDCAMIDLFGHGFLP